nr:hypothetical protein [Bradyrhizobium sp. 62]
MNLCNWDNLDEEIGQLTAAIRLGKANSSPFALLSLTDSPDDQLSCARTWVSAKLPHVSRTRSEGEVRRHDKIRVGYVSPDFRKHPVGYLTAEIFESHDPDRFETYAFSIGPDDNSDLRRRLEKSFHRFVDCEHKLDGEVLKAIEDAQIDILVDLAGHTHNARLSLFASSPAPIVVNYLGFAGTLGAGSSSITSLPIQSCCQIKTASSSTRRSFVCPAALCRVIITSGQSRMLRPIGPITICGRNGLCFAASTMPTRSIRLSLAPG